MKNPQTALESHLCPPPLGSDIPKRVRSYRIRITTGTWTMLFRVVLRG
jgi:hypothetical protein